MISFFQRFSRVDRLLLASGFYTDLLTWGLFIPISNKAIIAALHKFIVVRQVTVLKCKKFNVKDKVNGSTAD